MKILALASLLATVIICPPADARSIQTQRHEVLHNVSINGEKTRYTALLDMDFTKHTINLAIVNDICGQYRELPPGTMRCMAMAMPVQILNVPMNSVKPDGCGSYIYQGAVNDTPRDGLLKEITVTDNAARTCENVIESILVIDAKVESGRPHAITNYHITK